MEASFTHTLSEMKDSNQTVSEILLSGGVKDHDKRAGWAGRGRGGVCWFAAGRGAGRARPGGRAVFGWQVIRGSVVGYSIALLDSR